MMDAKYFAEIRARDDAELPETAAPVFRDRHALLAEVDELQSDCNKIATENATLKAEVGRQDQQIAALKKALEGMSDEAVAALHKLDKIGVINITSDGTAKELADYFIRKVQEQK